MMFSTIHTGPRKKVVPAKPKKRKKLVAVKVTKDGRWICNLKSADGKRMYRGFIYDMWNKQGFACCLCRKPLSLGEATFEHTDLRSGGRRNDLPEYTKPNGEVIRNGVAHGLCNSQKGSKRT